MEGIAVDADVRVEGVDGGGKLGSLGLVSVTFVRSSPVKTMCRMKDGGSGLEGDGDGPLGVAVRSSGVVLDDVPGELDSADLLGRVIEYSFATYSSPLTLKFSKLEKLFSWDAEELWIAGGIG